MDALKTCVCLPLGVADIIDVMALERLCFRTRWTREQFLLGLERGAYRILGVRQSGALVAYVAYSLIAGEMEILNIATHPSHRRKGLAAGLLGAAIGCCRGREARECFLEVRRSNHPAIDLYRKFGFTQVGVRKNYYPDNNEDALLFRLDFAPPADGAQ